MPNYKDQAKVERLVLSVTASDRWHYSSQGSLNRLEAFFTGAAYAPHRHDTYTIGVTLAGVQSFNYRGTLRHSLPGEAVILHPDELHDGQAGTEIGFHYKTLYIAPSIFQDVLSGRPLPFIEGGISRDPLFITALIPLLDELPANDSAFIEEDALFDLITRMEELSGAKPKVKPKNYQAAQRARELIHEQVEDGICLEWLAHECGHDKWELSRDFRDLFGTSPYRYLVFRRLNKAVAMLKQGSTISDAAYAAQFADQSHFTRQFKKTYGLTPKKWLTAYKAYQ